jgi:eukaryotic-like serine/threonine-protein kinase
VAIKCPKCHSENPETVRFCGECGTQLIPSKGPQVSKTLTLETQAEGLTRGTLFAGRYEIIEELGTGGMGRVYRAFDKKIDEEVALKLIKPEIAAEKRAVERFRNELKVARRISHPNVCRMHDLGEEGKTLYITMEYVKGEDLKSLLHRMKALTIGAAISISRQVAEGLSEAHKLGIVHRDLKPGNIMIDKEGQAKIMDFGIARSLAGGGTTAEGAIIGTPEYMSPEQVEGKEADQRSDIYALGIILFEMVTGRLPFEGETPFSIANKQKSEPPPDPRKLNPQIPAELDRVILRSLEKAKEKRYQTTWEFLADLAAVEEALPTGERISSQPKPKTSREITVKFAPKKLFVPALALLVLVATGIILWRYIPRKETVSTAIAKKSIAVLPFEDLSATKNQEPLAEGIPETLINALSSIEGLHVSARTSSFFFKGRQQDIRDIGQKLGVETLLEGSIQVAGTKLRIMVRLIKIANGFPIWSQDYDKTVDDIFSIQDDIAKSVVNALKIKLLGEKEEHLVKSYTANREVYNLYLQGRYFWEKRGKEDVERAIEFFNRAIEKDPTYALAYAGLADSYQVLGNTTRLPPNEAFPKAISAARKALEIDGGLAEAHVSLAMSLWNYEHNFVEAEKEFKMAIELNPGYATAHHWFALVLSNLGRHDEAIKEIMQARDLDPLSPHINANVGALLSQARKYDKAIEELKKSAELFPEDATSYFYLGGVYALMGRYEEAINVFNHLSSSKAFAGLSEAWSAYCYALSGNRAEAQKRLEKIVENSKKRYVSPTNIARVYVGLGDKEQAFIWLDKGFSENDGRLIYLKVDPTFDPLRSDPRFTALLQKIGFEK